MIIPTYDLHSISQCCGGSKNDLQCKKDSKCNFDYFVVCVLDMEAQKSTGLYKACLLHMLTYKVKTYFTFPEPLHFSQTCSSESFPEPVQSLHCFCNETF